MASIFTQIINGDIPSLKLMEDDLTYAFMDIRPIQQGHSLIVPKLEVDHFTEVPQAEYRRVFENAQVLAQAIKKATNCQRVGLVVAGYEVPHFHLHLIPTWGLSDFDFTRAKEVPHDELVAVQKKILNSL